MACAGWMEDDDQCARLNEAHDALKSAVTDFSDAFKKSLEEGGGAEKLSEMFTDEHTFAFTVCSFATIVGEYATKLNDYYLHETGKGGHDLVTEEKKGSFLVMKFWDTIDPEKT